MPWMSSDPEPGELLANFAHRLALLNEYIDLAEAHGRGEKGRSRHAVEVLNTALGQLLDDFENMDRRVSAWINENDRTAIMEVVR